VGPLKYLSRVKGTLCITHHYSVFNQTGDYFAETFTETNKVILVNLRDRAFRESKRALSTEYVGINI